jgi:hypothetical protein
LTVELEPGKDRLLLMRALRPKLETAYKMSVTFYVTTPEF